MPKGLWLGLALLGCLCGSGWLALAMDEHWQQVKGAARPLGRATAIRLRAAGIAALLLAMLCCGRADHASMAALVWIMTVSASALLVALALAWRPRCLAFLAGR